MTPQMEDFVMKHDALLLLVLEVVIRFLRQSPLHSSCIRKYSEVFAVNLQSIGALE
jgi:hypothetical protein